MRVVEPESSLQREREPRHPLRPSARPLLAPLWAPLLWAALLTCVGCTSDEPRFSARPLVEGALAEGALAAEAPAAEAPAEAPAVQARCPMEVPGTAPSAVLLDDGAAIDFVTSIAANVAELRRQVARKVRVHQEHHREPDQVEPLDEARLARMPEAERERTRHRWNHRRLIGTSTVTGEEIDGGMRVKLVPADPAELDALFGAVRETNDELVAFGPRCPDEDHH